MATFPPAGDAWSRVTSDTMWKRWTHDAARPHRRCAPVDRGNELDTAGDARPGDVRDRGLPLRRGLPARDRHPRARAAESDRDAAGRAGTVASGPGHRHDRPGTRGSRRLAGWNAGVLARSRTTRANRPAGAHAAVRPCRGHPRNNPSAQCRPTRRRAVTPFVARTGALRAAGRPCCASRGDDCAVADRPASAADRPAAAAAPPAAAAAPSPADGADAASSAGSAAPLTGVGR